MPFLMNEAQDRLAVVFGEGDVVISVGTVVIPDSRGPMAFLGFNPAEEAHEVGEDVDPASKDSGPALLSVLFPDRKALDFMIEKLSEARDQLPE